MRATRIGAALSLALVFVAVAPGARASDPYGLAPGDAEVRVSPDLFGFVPRTGVPLRLQVILFRPGPALPQGTKRDVWVRYHVHSSCRSKLHADKGKLIGKLTAFSDGRGHMLATTRRTVRFQHPGEVRFCVWLAGARHRTRLFRDYVTFYDHLFAAAMTANGSFSPPFGVTFGAASTDPFSVAYQLAGCAGHPIQQSYTTPDSLTSLYGPFVAGGGIGAGPGCPASDTLTVNGAGGQTLGTLSLSVAEATASPRATRVLGGCFLVNSPSFTVAEAEAYVAAAGCSVRHVINRPAPPTLLQQPGEVYAFEENGGRVFLAPRGSPVDLIVNSAG